MTEQENKQPTAKRYELANFADEDGMPILVNSIMKNHYRGVAFLLICGADPDAKDKLGCSVLEHACMKGDQTSTALLLRFGASFDENATSGERMKDMVDRVLGDSFDFVQPKREFMMGGAHPDYDSADPEMYSMRGVRGRPGMSGIMDRMIDRVDRVPGLGNNFGFEFGIAMGDPEEKKMTAGLFRGRPPRIFLKEKLKEKKEKGLFSFGKDAFVNAFQKGKISSEDFNGFSGTENDEVFAMMLAMESNEMDGDQKNDNKSKKENVQLFEEEDVTLSGSLSEVQHRLQDCCCTGDEEGMMQILNIPHVPIWVRAVDSNGVDALAIRPRTNKPEVFAKTNETATVTTSSSSSSTQFPLTNPSSSSSTSPSVFPQKQPSSPFTRVESAPKKQLKPEKSKSNHSLISEDDDSYVSDEESGSEFETEETRAINKGSGVATIRRTIDGVAIDTMIREQCDEISLFFESFTPEIAEMVLRYFAWSLDLESIGNLMDKGYDEKKFKEVAGVFRASSSSKPSTQLTTCYICTSDKAPSQLFTLGCEHHACEECWQTYLDSRVTGLAAECLFAPCIGHNKYSQCGLIVPPSFFQKHSSVASFRLYKSMREGDYVRNCKKGVLAYCPGPDCGRICCVLGMTERDVIDQCVQIHCHCSLKVFCLGCVKVGNDHKYVQIHAPATCQNIADWTKKITEEARYFTFRIKHCPGKDCRAPIVKCGCGPKIICNDLDHCPNQACNHMTCKNCKTEFCWLCGELWQKHSNFYSCNKQLQDKAPSEFFKGCLERYDDHIKSLKLVTERETLSVNMFQFYRSKYPIIFQNDIFTEINNDLMKSYRVLAYSYVRRFYIKFAHDAQRNLYEMQQGMLESHNNQLVGMFEDFKKRYEAEAGNEDETALRQQLIQMHEFKLLLQGFRKNLIDSFSSWSTAAQ